MKEGIRIMVDAPSIFDGQKGPVRTAHWEIQQYGINIKRCRYCQGNEVVEKYFIPQQILDHQRLLGIDMLQLSYPSSPRGVRQILVNKEDLYNSGAHNLHPNTYKGWGSFPANLYVPIKKKWFTIQEARKSIQVIAVQNRVIKENLDWDQKIGTIQAGNGSYWDFYLSIPYKRAELQPDAFSHSSCVRERDFILLDEEDLKTPDKYFEKVGENMYVSPSGKEVLLKGAIYTPFTTENTNNLCLLKKYEDTGILEGNKTVSYRRYDGDEVMIYENEKFIDYASPCTLEKKDLLEEITSQ